jgi:hypothetical protein
VPRPLPPPPPPVPRPAPASIRALGGGRRAGAAPKFGRAPGRRPAAAPRRAGILNDPQGPRDGPPPPLRPPTTPHYPLFWPPALFGPPAPAPGPTLRLRPPPPWMPRVVRVPPGAPAESSRRPKRTAPSWRRPRARATQRARASRRRRAVAAQAPHCIPSCPPGRRPFTRGAPPPDPHAPAAVPRTHPPSNPALAVHRLLV